MRISTYLGLISSGDQSSAELTIFEPSSLRPKDPRINPETNEHQLYGHAASNYVEGQFIIIGGIFEVLVNVARREHGGQIEALEKGPLIWYSIIDSKQAS